MNSKKSSKIGRFRAVFAGFLLLMGMSTGLFLNTLNVSAVPNGNTVQNDDMETDYSVEGDTMENTEEGSQTTMVNTAETDYSVEGDEVTDFESNQQNNDGGTSGSSNNSEDPNADTKDKDKEEEKKGSDSCKKSLPGIGWWICPVTGAISKAVDWIYEKIEQILVIKPISTEENSPIYVIWKYCLGITNIVFIIFLLVVVYSQITGIGISNYGIKKALPKLIVVAIMVNLSFLICLLAVDISNILGNSLKGMFDAVQESALQSTSMEIGEISFTNIYAAFAGGTTLALIGGAVAFDVGAIWMLIPVALGAIVAVVTGLITMAMRQALVVLLVMISPLAIVASILPNTEIWYRKWKELFIKMLVFYPMFAVLYGASGLAGTAIIMSATDGFGVILGVAVQVFPLFFSWKLMQMSGTVLGNINAKMRGMAVQPIAMSRAMANSKRIESSTRRLVYGRTPVSRLRRRADNKRALREKYVETLQGIRKNEAEAYVQKKIAAGYDGTKSQGNEEFLKPNKYTRAAKDLATSGMKKEMRTLDTTHALGQYGNYFVNRDVRQQVETAKKRNDETALARIQRTDADYRRAVTAGQTFFELSRAQMTAENDSEADFNAMVSEFLDTAAKYKPEEDTGDKFSKYRHYIVSSAGGLGETGQTRVLGKIIAKAAAVESNQRRDINIIANKFPHMKREFRSMLVGYHVDDEGYATDAEGNRIEKIRGSLLQNDPSKLVLWDKVDENGPYYEWKDVNGNFVTKIYKKDKSAVKELLSNFDAPINDPINNLYGILAGIKPGDITGDNENLKYIGLDGYRTTIGRALLGFKEKNAAFSPMVKEMIAKGYIQNYAQEYLAYLDSLNKATKPGAFNVQDSDAISMLATIMNPDKWEEAFPTELIRGFRNVNGEQIYGIRYDANGNQIKVPAEEATREELMNRVKEKFIIPAAHKITWMVTKQTQSTADNQKPGTVEKWKELMEVFNEKWGEGTEINEDPYKQTGDMRQIIRETRERMTTDDGVAGMSETSGSSGSTGSARSTGSGSRSTGSARRTGSGSVGSAGYTGYSADMFASVTNFYNDVDDMYISNQNSVEDFAETLMEYCINHKHPGFRNVLSAFWDYYNEIQRTGRDVTCEEMRDVFCDLITQFCAD